jgi:hypothetical protein
MRLITALLLLLIFFAWADSYGVPFWPRMAMAVLCEVAGIILARVESNA